MSALFDTASIRWATFFSAIVMIFFGVGGVGGRAASRAGSSYTVSAVSSGSGIVFFVGAPAMGSGLGPTSASFLNARTLSSKLHLSSRTPLNYTIAEAMSGSVSSFSIISTILEEARPIVVTPILKPDF